jgi:diguanylate cyclase (GGDEF)-like protein
MATIENGADGSFYRYMEPLEVDATCVGCHADYELGSVRGAVSINIPMDEVDQQLQQTGVTLIGFAVVTLGLAVGASQLFVNRLQRKMDEASEAISEMAVTDELTDLPNRRATLERLAEEFSRAKRTLEPLSVIIVDIDHFKGINDRHGHAVGDAVLREVADRMRESIREYDVAGRIGGEEFLIISPATGLEAATGVADRVIEELRAEPVNVGDLVLNVTSSAGVGTIRSSDERGDVLLARADDALYVAKEAGRDRVRTQNHL